MLNQALRRSHSLLIDILPPLKDGDSLLWTAMRVRVHPLLGEPIEGVLGTVSDLGVNPSGTVLVTVAPGNRSLDSRLR